MPTVVLKKYAEPQKLTSKDILNTVTPLQYSEWLKNNVGIIPQEAEAQYQRYLGQWYANKQLVSSGDTHVNKLREDYIALLKKLQVIFKDDEEFNRLTNINFNNQTELKLAIPQFARKLKEIALYYVSKRDTIKKAKIKYNMIGAFNGLERTLYEYLLQAFTKKENALTVQSKEIYNSLQPLSTVGQNFKIEIEELYDTANYFDLEYSQQNNSTGVYDLSTANPLVFVLEDYIANFYNAFDVTEVPLSGLSNPLSQFVVCEESDDDINEQILAQLGQKYLGNDVAFLTGGFYDYDRRDVTLNLEQGNNFFYWFSGEIVREIPDGVYQDIPLSSIDWTNATGASAYDSADLLFVTVGNKIVEGAWLADTDFITVVDTMSATITDGKTFKFPYPGIGTSAEGGVWSGKLITDTKEPDKKFFPSEKSFVQTQKQIENLYWSAHSSISSSTPVYLQNTSLYRSGARASKKYQNSDKIAIRRDVGPDRLHDETPNGVFTGDLEAAWLYNFDETSIPIKNGTNSVYYPLTSFSQVSDLFFRYEDGADVPLSSIDVGSAFAGAIAGNALEDADMLIKLNSVCGPEIEAAWLRGTPLSAYETDLQTICNCEDGDYVSMFTGWKYREGVTQTSLSFKSEPGNYVRFVWTGPRRKINELKVFTGFQHDAACEYYKSGVYPSILDTNFLNSGNKDIYEKWKTCTCKTVHHSPLGHRGTSFLDYRYPTDFIVKDSQFPNNFSSNLWRGFDGLPYNQSKDLAWFKLSSPLEQDVGWGEGAWQTNTDDDFILEPGESYIYFRSDLNRCGFELPNIVMNQGYCESNINNCKSLIGLPEWRKAVMNEDGVWVDAGEASNMVLESGFFYTYEHKESNDFSSAILTYDSNIVNTVSGNYITVSATDPLIGEKVVDFSTPSLNFLIKIPLLEATPYWGTATFDNNQTTQFKRISNSTDNMRLVYDYLQVTQPEPSRAILSNDDVLQFELSECNNCFIWEQPMVFQVLEDNRRWNRIVFDNCVRSDILNFLQEKSCNTCSIQDANCYSTCPEVDLCGCADICYTSKVGVTATKDPSGLVFNTELSGIPVLINYYARNTYDLTFQVIDITNGVPPSGGVWVPPVSTIYSQALIPWMNLSNTLNPLVASEVSDELYARKELGLFTPDRLGTGKYELRNGKYELKYVDRDATSQNLIRHDGYTDDPYYVSEVNSSWMKNKQGQMYAGSVNTDKRQTYYPYTNNTETGEYPCLGMWDLGQILTPWDINGKWIGGDIQNERGLYPLTCGPDAFFNNVFNNNGFVKEWQNDIFGNQYFLMNGDSRAKITTSNQYKYFYAKPTNCQVESANDFLSAILNKYKNRLFESDRVGLILADEAEDYLTTEDGKLIVLGFL